MTRQPGSLSPATARFVHRSLRALLSALFLLALFAPSQTLAQGPPDIDTMLGGHIGTLLALVRSSDGNYFASAGTSDGTIKIWRTSDLGLERTIVVGSGVQSLSFSPKFPDVLAASSGNTAFLYHISDGSLIGSLSDTGYISQLALSPDGVTLATTNGADTKLWNLSTLPNPPPDPQVLHSVYQPIAFSADGSLIAACNGGTVATFFTATGTVFTSFSAGSGVYSLAFSPGDPNLIASYHNDQYIHLWRVATGLEVVNYGQFYPNYHTTATNLAFTPNGQNLLLSNRPGVYETLTGKGISSGYNPFVDPGGYSGQFLPDGQSYVVSDEGGRLKQYRTADGSFLGNVTKNQSYGLAKVVVTPDGSTLATVDNNGVQTMWNLATGIAGNVYSIANGVPPYLILSPSGKLMGKITKSGNTIQRAASGELVRAINDLSNTYAFTPGDTSLLTYNITDNKLRTWRLLDGTLTGSLTLGFATLGLGFSPDASLFALSGPNFIKIYSTKDGTVQVSLPPQPRIIGTASQMAWSSDGQIVASLSDDQVLRIWRLSDPNATPPGSPSIVQEIANPSAPFVTFALSPFGDTITTLHNDSTISLFRVQDGARLNYWTKETYGTTTLTYSPDASKIIWGRFDGTTVVTINPFPVALASVTVNPALVQGGVQEVTGIVNLNLPAPASGITVTLSCSNPGVAAVQDSVFVPAGETSASFVFTTSAVKSTTSITITGAYNGVAHAATLSVQPAIKLRGIRIAPVTVTGGFLSVGVVTLSAKAPKGGLVVPLSSSRAAAQVPASVIVPEGKTSAQFLIKTSAVLSKTTATVAATSGGVKKTTNVVVVPVTIASLTLLPNAVTGTENVIGVITLSVPAPVNTIITIKSDNPAAVPDTKLTMPAGTMLALFNINTTKVTTTTTPIITATANGLAVSATLTISP